MILLLMLLPLIILLSRPITPIPPLDLIARSQDRQQHHGGQVGKEVAVDVVGDVSGELGVEESFVREVAQEQGEAADQGVGPEERGT